jgi:hypothetical protein
MEPLQEHRRGLHLPNPLHCSWFVRVLPSRHFPPRWTIEASNDACFIVRDKNRHALAYVYFELEPGRRTAANLLTKDEAQRIAANVAKLPELVRRPQY